MNPSTSITAGTVILNAGSENFGDIYANVTLNNDAVNSGTIHGNATFNGTSQHKSGAVVTGDATFNDSSVKAGTVQGTVSGSAIDEANFQEWLQNNVGVNQYTGPGLRNGQWAYNTTAYASQAEADAANGNASYPAWLQNNVGVNQFTGAGSHNGQWAYNQTEYANEATAINAAANVAFSTRNLNVLSSNQWAVFMGASSSYTDEFGNVYYNTGFDGKLSADYVPWNGSYQSGKYSLQDAWPQVDDGNGGLMNDPNWTPTYHDEPIYTTYVNGFAA